MAELLQFDEWLFRLINIDWQHSWLDQWMPMWRNKYFWAPFYLFLLSFVGINYGKKAIWWVIALSFCVLVGDTLSSKVIKKSVQRPRPCHEVSVQPEYHLGVACGGGYSFPSSHATNHFAVAVFVLLSLGRRYSWIKLPLLLWAASIAYGQVYVGVHYPLDVSFGALLGSLIGWTVAYGYDYLTRRRGWNIF